MTITVKDLKRRFPDLLERCNAREAQTLLDALTQLQPPSGEELHRSGDRADSLYFIWEGSLSLALEAAGQQIPLGTLTTGQHIGSVAVIEPGPAPVTVTVAEPGTLLRLDHATLEMLRTDQPRLAGNLLRALSLDLAERLRIYEEQMTGRGESSDPEEFARLCRPLMGIKAG